MQLARLTEEIKQTACTQVSISFVRFWHEKRLQCDRVLNHWNFVHKQIFNLPPKQIFLILNKTPAEIGPTGPLNSFVPTTVKDFNSLVSRKNVFQSNCDGLTHYARQGSIWFVIFTMSGLVALFRVWVIRFRGPTLSHQSRKLRLCVGDVIATSILCFPGLSRMNNRQTERFAKMEPHPQNSVRQKSFWIFD